MKLLTKEIRRRLPKLKAQEDKDGEAFAHFKLFTPDSNWTWYVLCGEPVLEDGREVDFEFFALVHGFEKEFGYVFLSELESIRGPLGLPIERDRYWQPQKIKQIICSSHYLIVSILQSTPCGDKVSCDNGFLIYQERYFKGKGIDGLNGKVLNNHIFVRRRTTK